MDKVKIILNGKAVEVPSDMTVLQACQREKVEVPFFCYHPKLSVAGNCRMCLVEVDDSNKLVTSCSLKVKEGMSIRTNTEKVTRGRKGVLEFLLINHPLDCPVCDQGGECDLQDISFSFGSDFSRYHMEKRAVADKDLGPLIKTAMTRCIHCTRCIRFSNEIAGTPEIGSLGRGEDTEITTYIEKALTSELSGNMIDICPVGALTSKPGAFRKRSWELKKTLSIDVHDAVGSNIYVESRGEAVMQIRPRLNESINEEWISDKVRFSYDGLASQRLDAAYRKKNGRLEPCDWETAIKEASFQLGSFKREEIAALVGPLVDCESIFAFKHFLQKLGCVNMDSRLDGEYLGTAIREGYLFNTKISDIEKVDAVLLVGTNPRIEAPLINARWRKRFIKDGLTAGLIGNACDLTFPYAYLGNTVQDLEDIYTGTSSFSEKLKNAQNPMIVLGLGCLTREDSSDIYDLCLSIAYKYSILTKNKNNFNVLHTRASQVGALDLSFVPGKGGFNAKEIYKSVKKGKIKVLYLLGADEIPLTLEDVKDTFVIYQGHHGDRGAHLADLILPSPAYTEKDGTYVNTQGTAQKTLKAVSSLGMAKEDWRIIGEIAGNMKKDFPYTTLEELRKYMYELLLKKEGEIFYERFASRIGKRKEKRKTGFLKPIKSFMENFYMTDVISRHSKAMAVCTEVFERKRRKKHA